MRRSTGALAGMTLMSLVAVPSLASAQAVSASEGRIEVPGPDATSARAFAVVQNPTMYDVYLVSAASDVAARIEFRDGTGDEPEPRRELTVPAYGSLRMAEDGMHLVLLDLKRELKEGERIPITVRTDGSMELELDAVVEGE